MIVKRHSSLSILPRWCFLPECFWLFILCSILVLSFSFDSARADSTSRTLIDSGWRFNLGDPSDVGTAVPSYPEISNLAKLQSSDVSGTTSEAYLETQRPDPVATHMGETVSFVQPAFNDSAWTSLNLPHDWVVGLPFSSSADKGHGYKALISGSTSANTIGWYRRTFTLPSSDTGKTLSLEFDGVYRNCLVWFNGHIIGRNVSGYSSFSYDVTQYANPGGTNVLVVRVDASRFEGWFYEGAGIYRHVWLVATNPVHVAHWGTFVTSTVSGSSATLSVQTQVNNDGSNSATCNLTSAIMDSSGNQVATLTTSGIAITGGSNQVVTQTITVTNPKLWSLNSPNLYTLTSTVTQSGTPIDTYTTPFGIRTISWDPNQGVSLNGQRVEAKGVCLHQDAAGVGLALPDRLQYFRLEKIKAMGFNAIRTSHNSPTPELLDACDQLGLLVLDENRRFGNDPETLSQVQRGILRDRNHPCVFAWSLGNEEPLQGTTTGAGILQAMQNLAHQLDPTRLCTIAMNGSWGSGFSTVVDVQGFNYFLSNISGFHTGNPSMPSISTEAGSEIGDRGIYSTANSYQTSYDAAVSWGETAEAMWQFYNTNQFVAGFFNWTGFDYRGEPTPTSWPTISSHFGILDTCGFPKDNAWYFQANWLPKPIVHIFPHWNWTGQEGQSINVWCFSNCDTVQLFLNGVSQGTQAVNVLSHVAWSVPYAAGTLQAVGYINGLPVVTDTITTTGAPSAITLQPDRSTIMADGRDISLVTVSVVDSQGRVVPTATNTMTFTINGGTILGLGNGDPNDHESDQATNNIGVRSAFNGLAQVIVQSNTQTGPITLTANATGLSTTTVTINATTTLPVPAAPSGLIAVSGSGQATINWDIVPGAVSYNVKRSTTEGGPYTTLAGNTALNYFTDTELTNGITYYYVVSALNSMGESSNSVEISVVPMSTPIPPTISTVSNQTISQNTNTGALAFTVNSTSVSVSSLTVTASSSNPTLVPASGLVLGGSGANRTITITPAANASGTAPITLSVSDGVLTTTSNFTLTVTSALAISPINDRMINKNVATGAIAFTTTNGGVPSNSLSVSAFSSNPTLVPNGNIAIATTTDPWTSTDIGTDAAVGSSLPGDIFTLNASGADIWGTADAGHFISQPMKGNGQIIARVTSIENTDVWAKTGVMFRSSLTAGSPQAFMCVSAGNGVAFQYRTTSGGSSTQSAQITGITAPCWVKLVKSSTTFTAYYATDNAGTPGTWTQVGSPVTITLSTNFFVGLASTAHDNATGVLCTSTCDNVSGPANVGGNHSVAVTPASNMSGTTAITLTTSNGTLTSSEIFNLTVKGPPTISAVSNQTIGQNTPTSTLAFTIGTTEAPLSLVSITVNSSNMTLVPNANIIIGGSGANRTVTVMPTTGQAGSATITLTVNDGIQSTTSTFSVTVLTPLQTWRQQYFGSYANSGASADTANPSGDGVSNLIKYALGINPTVAATLGLPITYPEAGFLELQFNRNLSATDVSYNVIASNDLVTWTTIASRPSGSSTWSQPGASVTDNGGVVTVVDQVSIASQKRRFLKLNVTDP